MKCAAILFSLLLLPFSQIPAYSQSLLLEIAQGFRKPAGLDNAIYEMQAKIGPYWSLGNLADDSDDKKQPNCAISIPFSIGWGNPGSSLALGFRVHQKIVHFWPSPLPQVSAASFYICGELGYSSTISGDGFSRDLGGSYYVSMGISSYFGPISLDLRSYYMARTKFFIPSAGISIYL